MASTNSDTRFQAALAAARGGEALRARQLLEEAYRIDRKHQGIRNALAVLRLESGDARGALLILEPLAKELPKISSVQLNFGNALVASGNATRAVRVLQRASQIDANSPVVWYGLGRAHQLAGNPAAAVEAYRHTLHLNPQHKDARASLAAAYSFLDAFEDGEREARTVLAHRPDDSSARFNLAMALLAQGKWEEGWSAYEARHETQMLNRQRTGSTKTRWAGNGSNGETILLSAEQGYGDTIQFVRYAPALRARGYRIIIQCPTELVELLRASMLCDAVISFADVVPDHDWHLPLTSLPYALKLHTEEEVVGTHFPYLHAPMPDTGLEQQLRDAASPRIGLVWSGSSTHINDRHRSCGFSNLEPLWSLPGVTWVNLQVGEAGNVTVPSNVSLLDVRPYLTDFARSAQVVERLDAVVTVDSAMAHLAGALNHRAIVLLPRVGIDWRWVGPKQSKLYRSVTMIRQQATWKDAMVEATSLIKQWLRDP